MAQHWEIRIHPGTDNYAIRNMHETMSDGLYLAAEAHKTFASPVFTDRPVGKKQIITIGQSVMGLPHVPHDPNALWTIDTTTYAHHPGKPVMSVPLTPHQKAIY